MARIACLVFSALAAASCTTGSSGTCASCGLTEEMCAAYASDNGCQSYSFIEESTMGRTCWGGAPSPACSFEGCDTFPECGGEVIAVDCACGEPYADIGTTVEGVELEAFPAAIARPDVGGDWNVSIYLAGDAPECRADGSIGPSMESLRVIINGDPSVTDGPASVSLYGDTPTTESGVFAEEATATFDLSDPDCIAGTFSARFLFIDSSTREYNISGSFNAEKDGR